MIRPFDAAVSAPNAARGSAKRAAGLLQVCLPNRKRRAALSVGVLRTAQNIPSRNSAAAAPLLKAAPSCLIPGSQPECLRHSRGKKSLAGQKAGRHFAAGRETGIFPAKSAVIPPMCPRQAKFASQQISTPRLKLSSKSPGWPASNFRVLSPRDIYGTFCPGPIYPSKAGRRRRMRRRWRQRTAPPSAPQPHEESLTPPN